MISKFGEFLYELRKEKGFTQSELAEKLGITNKAVSKWETGEAFPETAQLVPLSNIFSVSVDELLRGERNKNYIVEDVVKDNEQVERCELKPMTKAEAMGMAGAIALILVSVLMLTMMILNEMQTRIAVPSLLLCVMVAVFFIINISMRRSIRSVEITEDDFDKGKKCIYMISSGVAIVIFSVACLIALVYISLKIALPVFFIILIIGIFFLVFGGISWDGINKKYNFPSDDVQKSSKSKHVEDAICSAIMLTATGIFLLMGFIYDKWHPAWVVFPIGGIVCGIVSTIIKGIDGTK